MLDGLRQEALNRSQGLAATPASLEKLGRATTQEAARWAFTQWALRARARAKFRLADQMLFSREALEQATSEPLAAYHASRFPRGARVADLTAGIGADLIALAARGPAVGFELDEERAAYARHNLAVYGVEAEVRVEDSLAAPWDFSFAYADPARRVEGSRTLDPESFQPNPRALAARMAPLGLGVMKLSTMLPDAFLRSFGASIEFLSLGRECRETLLLFDGSSAVQAVRVETGARLNAGAPPQAVGEPLEYFYEADPAAIRADALGSLASDLDLVAIGDSNGYLTSDRKWLLSSWIAPYRVLASLKADVGATRRVLEELGSATPIVKSRAVCDVQALQRRWKLTGRRGLIVAVYAVGKSLRHLILEPINS